VLQESLPKASETITGNAICKCRASKYESRIIYILLGSEKIEKNHCKYIKAVLAEFDQFLNIAALDYIVKRIVQYDDQKVRKEEQYAEIPVFLREINKIMETQIIYENIGNLKDRKIQHHKVYML
jgi:hypothetical protein